MENERALQILIRLADGVHPVTGEKFSPDSPYQEADTVRALYAAILALRRGRVGRAGRTGSGNSGKPWTSEEESTLLSRFEGGLELSEIAAQHQRSRYAIEVRLVRLGKLQPEQLSNYPRNGRGLKISGQA